MSRRIDLPGGQWADIKTVEELTGADQDVIFDKYDEITEAKPAPEPQPDPANPAVMLPAAPRRFSNADGRQLRDTTLSLIITAWSFDLPLPYSAEARRQLPLPVCNQLYEEADPVQDALLGVKEAGEDPKTGESAGSDGSTGTSPGSTESPLPAPPAAASVTPSA